MQFQLLVYKYDFEIEDVPDIRIKPIIKILSLYN